ncbi:MAG: 2-C-methyl-D-erythritol 4-phosphate cytidylyltransferase [Lachnospiraceae bacterium]|jgi:2-C-methyl-D-erythritol 4-phosphate cytidylyltransferase|nr:2-C-methyl-D-erythritol 4-phosphate cytidylyltransferase [Lachnospiraceae bacterium]
MNISIILSGGSGLRFGSEKPKQYHILGGKEVIAYVVEAVSRSRLTDKTLIVASAPLAYEADYAPSGKMHNDSVKSALDHIHAHYPECEKVVFLDAARPFVTGETVDKYYEFLDDYDAVITAQRITDSLGKEGVRFVDRTDYFLIQKPEAFRFALLYEHFAAESAKTAIVQQLPDEARVYNYFDYGLNLKITYPDDIIIAEELMNTRGDQL